MNVRVELNKVDVLYMKMKWDEKFVSEKLKEKLFDIIFVYI